MLQFFRKHQKGFFLFTTVIIVCSFAFFGTFQAFMPTRSSGEDPVVFQTSDGKKIKQSTLALMTHFLAHESLAVPIPRPPLADNVLNDGVISKDFLETGLAKRLFEAHPERFRSELSEKQTREQGYTPYVHTKNAMIAADKVWSVFAPELPEKLAAMRAEDPATAEGFSARVDLFLAERQFPAPMLGQILRYQQQDAQNLGIDTRLYRDEISLFGYHNLTDWFGQTFMDEMAKCILDGAALARKQGYHVSREEALTDLLYRAEQAFQVAKEQLTRPIPNGYAYFQQLARIQGTDVDTLVSVWQDVLLFRRLFDAAGSTAVVETLPMEEFYTFAHESAIIDLIQLPKELQLHTKDEVEQFEAYLAAVAPSREDPLELPTEYLPLETIEQSRPELVGRAYRLDVASLTRDDLRSKVTLKQTWEWELDAANWEKLRTQFKDLPEASTVDERVAALETFASRAKVDAYAEKQIIEANFDAWMPQALIALKPTEKTYFLRNSSPFGGIKDISALIDRLDTEDEIVGYTQDGKTYYTFTVLERAPEKSVLTFAEMRSKGVKLDPPEDITPLVNAVYQDARAQALIEHPMPEELRADFIPPYRFAAHLRTHPEGSLFCPVETTQETLMRSEDQIVPLDEALALDPDTLSPVRVNAKEGAHRYRFIVKRIDKTVPVEKMLQAQEMLATEAKRDLFDQLLQQTTL